MRSRLVLALFICFCFGGCSRDKGNNNPPPANPVWTYNASFQGGYTVHWPDGKVYVKSWDNRVKNNNLQLLLDEINALIAPAKLVIQKGNHPVDIEISYNPGLGQNQSMSSWFFNGNYYLYHAVIQMGNFDDTGTTFYNHLKHELIHTAGFFGNTDDGGVMDHSADSGTVTELVAKTLADLYSLPAGTFVNL